MDGELVRSEEIRELVAVAGLPPERADELIERGLTRRQALEELLREKSVRDGWVN